jgi:phosphonate transport system permease protein
MVLRETWQTVAIATAGLALALLGAIPATLIITERLSISRLGTGRMRRLSRAAAPGRALAAGLLRSVPELVWALLFVRVVGLGPTAGVLAIALTYAACWARCTPRSSNRGRPRHRALLPTAAGACSAASTALLPERVGAGVSYTVYRWECAIRGSAVLGFVGAGGLGQRMDNR